MTAIAFLMLLTLFVMFLSSLETENSSKIDREKMKRSILDIEKILNLNDAHYEIELDRMSDQDLTKLYQDLGDKFDLYIIERNAASNKKALEDF